MTLHVNPVWCQQNVYAAVREQQYKLEQLFFFFHQRADWWSPCLAEYFLNKQLWPFCGNTVGFCRHLSRQLLTHLSMSADTLASALTRCGITWWLSFIIYFSDKIKYSGRGSVTREDHYLSTDSGMDPYLAVPQLPADRQARGNRVMAKPQPSQRILG